MGVMWGLISVAIASFAQLSLGFAMMRLPSIAHPLAFISGWAHLMPRPWRYSPVWRGIWFPSSAGRKHYTRSRSAKPMRC